MYSVISSNGPPLFLAIVSLQICGLNPSPNVARYDRSIGPLDTLWLATLAITNASHYTRQEYHVHRCLDHPVGTALHFYLAGGSIANSSSSSYALQHCPLA